MNRADRRRAERQRRRVQTSDGVTSVLTALGGVHVQGPQVDVLFARQPQPTAGVHEWIVTAAWRVDPARWVDSEDPAMLDLENMLTMAGPGCYWCEQVYSADVAARPCPGEPRA